MFIVETWFISSIIGMMFFLLFTVSAVTDWRLAKVNGWLGQQSWAFGQIIAGLMFASAFLIFAVIGQMALVTSDAEPSSEGSAITWFLTAGNILWTLGGAVIWVARYRSLHSSVGGRGEDDGAEIRDRVGLEESVKAVAETAVDTQERVVRIERTVVDADKAKTE